MSDKQELVVRKLIEEVWNQGKFDILDTLVDGQLVTHDPLKKTVGIEQLKDEIKMYRTAFPDLRLQILDIFSAADKVVVRWQSAGTHRGPFQGIPPTGKSGIVTGIAINRFIGDHIAETFMNWDTLGLLQQLGVLTLPGKLVAVGA